jgi:leucyl-tRNA synthetase
MDTFVDSSWYYSRYTDPKNSKLPFDKKTADSWLPVDQYIGGIEHACMHLIYSRFWHKVMFDLGLVSSEEPFTKLLTQGMVTLGGSAMSKSKGNVVAPEEITSKYGTDTIRLFILFTAPPSKQLDWSPDGVEGSWRFLNRVWRLAEKVSSAAPDQPQAAAKDIDKLLRAVNHTIVKVTSDIEKEQQLNTAISSVMELVNSAYVYPANDAALRKAVESIVLLLAPFTPHICEEIWRMLGRNDSVRFAAWPAAEGKYLQSDTIEIPIQINGKLRGKITIPAAIKETDLHRLVAADPHMGPHLGNKKVVKFIYVPGKIINIVVK